jgi:hypothetical protein
LAGLGPVQEAAQGGPESFTAAGNVSAFCRAKTAPRTASRQGLGAILIMFVKHYLSSRTRVALQMDRGFALDGYRGDLSAFPPKTRHDHEILSGIPDLRWRLSALWRLTRGIPRSTLHQAETLHDHAMPFSLS